MLELRTQENVSMSKYEYLKKTIKDHWLFRQQKKSYLSSGTLVSTMLAGAWLASACWVCPLEMLLFGNLSYHIEFWLPSLHGPVKRKRHPAYSPDVPSLSTEAPDIWL